MYIDVQARQLPPGFLVNKGGRSCRVSKSDNKVHCGGQCGINKLEYCEDATDKQCEECRVIQGQMNSIYAGINEFGVVKY